MACNLIIIFKFYKNYAFNVSEVSWPALRNSQFVCGHEEAALCLSDVMKLPSVAALLAIQNNRLESGQVSSASWRARSTRTAAP